MKGKKSERIILQKMLRYCDEIEQILKKHSFNREEFDKDTDFQFACGMCIIQIRELVTELEENFVSKYPDIPWRQIKGMRNIFAHDYDIVDLVLASIGFTASRTAFSVHCGKSA